jgi:transcriptional regulator with XRE-family HTH domain
MDQKGRLFTVLLRREAAKVADEIGQNELARRAHIDKGLFSRYLDGFAFLSADSLDRLAAAAGITVVRRSELERLRAIERASTKG